MKLLYDQWSDILLPVYNQCYKLDILIPLMMLGYLDITQIAEQWSDILPPVSNRCDRVRVTRGWNFVKSILKLDHRSCLAKVSTSTAELRRYQHRKDIIKN